MAVDAGGKEKVKKREGGGGGSDGEREMES